MTKAEYKVWLKLKRWKRLSNKLEGELAHAREVLGEECTHPPEAVRDYEWKHDDGYGRQRWLKGDECQLCLARKPWKSSVRWVTCRQKVV